MSLFSYLRFIYKGIQKFEIEIRKKKQQMNKILSGHNVVFPRNIKIFVFNVRVCTKRKRNVQLFFFLRESRMFTEKCYSLSLLKYPTSMCS